MEGFDNTYFVIGYDWAGNPLEVMYNLINEATIKVFHARYIIEPMTDNLERTGHETQCKHETRLHDISDEEYDALDELLMSANPERTGIPGVFANQRTLLSLLDTVAANYSQPALKLLTRLPIR